jgi:hypothetical protein
MTHDFTAVIPTYWIAHSRGDVRSGFLAEGERISTGLDYLETHVSPLVQQQRIAALAQDYPRAVAEWLEMLRLRDPFAHLADYRWRKETGGLTLTTGVRVLTTRESQSQMTSTIVALKEGLVSEPVQWKAETGWVAMTLEQMRAAAAEVAEHVSKCFTAEEIVSAQLVENPDLDVEAAFDVAYGAL